MNLIVCVYNYRYMSELQKGLSTSVVLYTYTPGGSIVNHHFVWRVPDDFSVEAAVTVNQGVVAKLMTEMPIYHTRAMKKDFISHYGLLLPETKPYMLRSIYKELTKDLSGSRTFDESQIDARVKEALDAEDIDIIIDLREMNEGRAAKYDDFWAMCSEYLSECTAVPDRRHGNFCFMAKAVSVRDLIQQVKLKCAPETPIPSESWVRRNFSPRNLRVKSSQHYTGVLKVKHMVQKRLFRKAHPDEHYCSALFRYQREFAVKFRHNSIFISIDDKHRIKVGEPGYPVAATNRGREVIVSQSDTFVVGDHDFTRFSIIPSVALLIDIPEKFEGSWYKGKVLVGFKDAVFQASSPLRHACEIHSALLRKIGDKSILLIYSDGGPDHRLTYVSVKLSLIALFLNLNLDILIACRTAPNHSWRNPVERIMSIVNIGLQCVGMMRQKMSEEFESSIINCNNIQQLRQACVSNEDIFQSSLAAPIGLLHEIMQRLELKGEVFEIYHAATEDEITEFWSTLLLIESKLTRQFTTAKHLKEIPDMCVFLEHCCQSRHYSFQIRKCAVRSCKICKPLRMDEEEFKATNFLPDPVPDTDGHYKSFFDLFGQPTTEEFRPSLKNTSKSAKNVLGYAPSQQHVNNVGLLVQCEECDMWRLLFCKYKLNYQENCELQTALDDISYTCGMLFDELEFPGRLKNVGVKDHKCHDHIEKLYYSCEFDLICAHCASEDVEHSLSHLPQCKSCQEKGTALIKRPQQKK